MASRVKVILETPSRDCEGEFLAAVRRSRSLHHPWLAAPATTDAFQAYMKKMDSPSYASYWVRTRKGELAGVVNISEIVRGSFHSAYLSYYAFVPHNGSGHMTEGL